MNDTAVKPKTMREITDGDIMLFEREIGSIDWAENQTRKLDIKQQPNLIKRFLIHVDVAVVTGTAAIAVPADAPFNMIRNIRLRTSQGLTLKNFSGYQINALNSYEFYAPAYNTIPANLNAGTHVFGFDIIIPFEDHTNILKERCILNSNQYNDMTLYITWEEMDVAFPDWVDPTDVVTYIYCQVVSCERSPMDRPDLLLDRQQMIDNAVIVPATEPFVILPENTNIKTLMAITRDGDGLRVNTPVDRFTVDYDSGNYVLRDMTSEQIQSQNKQYYHVENIADGIYIIEFDQLHDFKSLFRTKNRNYARLVFTPPAIPIDDATIEIFRRRIATPKRRTA